MTSVLTRVKLARALRRLGLDLSAVADAVADIATSDITSEVVALAQRIGPSTLRTLGALHLASAVLADVDVIVTYDIRLAEAAQSVGLSVAAPSGHR